MAFKTGDIVMLKSGGPDMTVQSATAAGSNIFFCQWFAGKKLENGRFQENSLELSKKGEE